MSLSRGKEKYKKKGRKGGWKKMNSVHTYLRSFSDREHGGCGTTQGEKGKRVQICQGMRILHALGGRTIWKLVAISKV